MTFTPSEVYQPDRWALALPSCAFSQGVTATLRWSRLQELRHFRVSMRPGLEWANGSPFSLCGVSHVHRLSGTDCLAPCKHGTIQPALEV